MPKHDGAFPRSRSAVWGFHHDNPLAYSMMLHFLWPRLSSTDLLETDAAADGAQNAAAHMAARVQAPARGRLLRSALLCSAPDVNKLTLQTPSRGRETAAAASTRPSPLPHPSLSLALSLSLQQLPKDFSPLTLALPGLQQKQEGSIQPVLME